MISKDETPMMRRGPNGPGTLCNPCGLKWSHTVNFSTYICPVISYLSLSNLLYLGKPTQTATGLYLFDHIQLIECHVASTFKTSSGFLKEFLVMRCIRTIAHNFYFCVMHIQHA